MQCLCLRVARPGLRPRERRRSFHSQGKPAAANPAPLPLRSPVRSSSGQPPQRALPGPGAPSGPRPRLLGRFALRAPSRRLRRRLAKRAPRRQYRSATAGARVGDTRPSSGARVVSAHPATRACVFARSRPCGAAVSALEPCLRSALHAPHERTACGGPDLPPSRVIRRVPPYAAVRVLCRRRLLPSFRRGLTAVPQPDFFGAADSAGSPRALSAAPGPP